ncbi:MAG: XRE family transcriptional regulator, partial [Egibacteraceae bacterium]
QREEFEAALRDAVDLLERLSGQPLTLFGRDAGLLASYAVTSHAAASCNWVGLAAQARRYATDALDLLTAVPEKDRIPGKEAVARIELALALVGLGSPDEACDLGHEALSSERTRSSVPVRARALDLDAALQRAHPDLPEAGEFHERCRLLTRPSPPELAT